MMGAYFEEHKFKAASKPEAITKAHDYQQQQQHESGHGPYTGHLGTAGVGTFSPGQTFKDFDEARAYASERHHKWDLPMLMKVGDGDDWLLAGWCAS